MNNENKIIIDKVKKYFKKYNNIIEIELFNYEGINYYIRLDSDKKNGYYYLRSYNLAVSDKFNKGLINQEIVSNQLMRFIFDRLETINMDNIDLTHSDKEYVSFSYTYDNKTYNYKFNQFIPREYPFIADIMYAVFSNLPHRLYPLFDELLASLNNDEIKYTYNKEFTFNLFKGKLEKVFNDKVILSGENVYEEHKVVFLEKIHDSYYAVVEGNNNKLYTVIIDKFDKNIRMNCTCPCEFRCKHMYAALKAIRNKEEYKYYKVRYIDPKVDTYAKMMTTAYFLCIGYYKDTLTIVNPNGEITSLHILDYEGNSLFEVVEDDANKTLTNYINDIKNK